MNPSLRPPVPELEVPVLPPAAVAPAGVREHRSNLRRWAVAAILVVMAAGLAGWLPRRRNAALLREQTRELAIPSVFVTVPVPGKSPADLPLPAELRAFTEAAIYARANGYVKRWLVDLGGAVESGQLLAELDAPELRQELARTRAESTRAEAALALAQTTAARWRELLKTASVSEQEAAEKEADLAVKAAVAEASRAEARRAEEMLSFTQVAAPFAGVITERRVDVGELVSAAAGRALFHLAETRRLRVFVRVPQALARAIRPGQTAELTLNELPGRIFPATVARAAGAMDNQSRTLLTELEVDNARGEILAGSFAQVRFRDARADAALTVPANSLIFRPEGPHLGLVSADGIVELRLVTLGRDFGPSLEILGGVTAADRVILNPADSLVGGQRVRISVPPKPAAHP